jgi:type II secretory pathway pseudopilin PulG
MNKKGFTFIELILGLSIMAVVFISVMGYIMVVGKTERKVKLTIDRFNVAQSILTELKNWDYRGTNKKNLTALKKYLEDTSPEYLEYMMGESLYNIVSGGAGTYYLKTDEGTLLRVIVNLDYMQEDTTDIDGDGIKDELVRSNSDQNIMRITVSVAEHFKNITEDQYVWATAVGYKGVKSNKPVVDTYFNDISDDDVVITSEAAVLLAMDYRKNADIINGLNNLDNVSPYDEDGLDNDEDGKADYSGGDALEADSDGLDNNSNGIVDEAFEQNDYVTHYEGTVFSADPFKLLHVYITDPTGTTVDRVGSYTANDEYTVYTWAVTDSGGGAYSGGWSINSDTPNGKYKVEITARTNPDLDTGVSLDPRSYEFIVDTQPPAVTEISPAPGTFVASTDVTLAVTAKDNPPAGITVPTSGLDRVYVMEKKEYEVSGEMKYSWELVKHQLIDKETSDVFSTMNVGVNLEDVTEGYHYYRVVVKDRSGNVSYKETEVYVTDEPDIKPPRIYPLIPYDPLDTAVTGSPTPQIAARIVDSTIISGIETESGVDVDPINGLPRVVYKILEPGDPETVDWDTLAGFTDITAQVAYIKHNVNNVTLQFTTGATLEEGDTVLVGIYAQDKAQNYSTRVWKFTYSTGAVSNNPFIEDVTVQQLANHPNLSPPYLYNPDWVSGALSQVNRNFFIGWHSSDSDGIAITRLHYTAVGDTLVTYEKSSSILELPIADSFGYELTDLNISQPGTFYYYIEVIDGSGNTSYYYRTDAASAPEAHQTAPTDITSQWVPVKVEQVRVLVFDMDTDETGTMDNVSPYYTLHDGPLYWNDEDCTIIETAQNTDVSTLIGYMDPDGNGLFDDYDLVIFFTGTMASPPGFSDGFIQLLHSWMTAPYADFRTFYASLQEGINGDLDFFHYTGDKTVTLNQYSSVKPPRVAFIGKRFFHNFDATSVYTTDLRQLFIRRWLGFAAAGKQDYTNFTSYPYVVSNLLNTTLWSSGTTLMFNDVVFGSALGVMKQDADGNDLSRATGANYLRHYLLNPLEGEYYDGYADQTDPVPQRWNLAGEVLSSEEKLAGKMLLANPGIHTSDYNGLEGYLMASKQCLVFGYDPDNAAYTAGVWVYKGVGAGSDWDFSIHDGDPNAVDTKLLFLGFGIEAISTENWRYEAMKSLVRFLYY